MLHTRLKVKSFGNGVPIEVLMERLHAVGYVKNIKIDQDKQTIAFEYATFRDKDGVLMELQKMRISCVECLNVSKHAKQRSASKAVPFNSASNV